MHKLRLFTIFAALILFFFQLSAFADLPSSNVSLDNFTVEQLQQAAEAGDPDAQYALGYMYYYGKNVSKDTSMAQNMIKRAAVQGQPQAIAAMRMMGQNVAVNANPLEDAADTQDAAPAAPKSAAKAPKPVAPIAAQTNKPTVANAAAPTNNKPKAASHYYTIALLETANLASMQSYIKTHRLQGKANYATTQKNGRNWYSLNYGKYGSLKAAKAGVRTLPASIRAQKPQLVGKNDMAA